MTHATPDARAAALLEALPEPAGDDRVDLGRRPTSALEVGLLELAWRDAFAVPRERRRRLRGVLDYFWGEDNGATLPAAILYAAAYHAPTDRAPWHSPLPALDAGKLAEHFAWGDRAGFDPSIGLIAWQLAYWLDDDGRPLPPPRR